MDTLINLLEQSWQWSGQEIGIAFAILLGTFVVKWVFMMSVLVRWSFSCLQ